MDIKFTEWIGLVLKKENISCVVAPYEADAQMTFLAISKHVDAVITEDSDLIPFGCPTRKFKAPRVSPKHTSPTSEILQFDSSEETVSGYHCPKKDRKANGISFSRPMRGVQHSKHTIHPCIASQKESEPNSFLGENEGKTRV
ncbi:putative exodeoxyribonuclease I [Helianthus annuus]|uniref:Exodeoxyribonuclease I n=1 Tax=Helianthus annuus TaxID=4232 RepID=A0A9K3IWR4_HELAN|nr:putative exodeoxyribonuclease I [Helianthus annuus]KAJ0746031.1 putative exodeoxyribonuclease I [Helianthus annuus]KAJ0749036.1 putative exodeoxyribonuclease I [Helianthus annuus]